MRLKRTPAALPTLPGERQLFHPRSLTQLSPPKHMLPVFAQSPEQGLPAHLQRRLALKVVHLTLHVHPIERLQGQQGMGAGSTAGLQTPAVLHRCASSASAPPILPVQAPLAIPLTLPNRHRSSSHSRALPEGLRRPCFSSSDSTTSTTCSASKVIWEYPHYVQLSFHPASAEQPPCPGAPQKRLQAAHERSEGVLLRSPGKQSLRSAACPRTRPDPRLRLAQAVPDLPLQGLEEDGVINAVLL